MSRAFAGLGELTALPGNWGSTKSVTMSDVNLMLALMPKRFLPQAVRRVPRDSPEWFAFLKQVTVGVNIEREHTDVSSNPNVWLRIALAHLNERLDYYVRLKKYVER